MNRMDAHWAHCLWTISFDGDRNCAVLRLKGNSPLCLGAGAVRDKLSQEVPVF